MRDERMLNKRHGGMMSAAVRAGEDLAPPVQAGRAFAGSAAMYSTLRREDDCYSL